MLHVDTRIQLSPIHGLGLFAAQFIPQGTLVWQRDDKLDVQLTLVEILRRPKPTRDLFSIYAYEEIYPGNHQAALYTLCGDGARHMNHSDAPNLTVVGLTDCAARDIAEGEEITVGYASFGTTSHHRIDWGAEARRYPNLLPQELRFWLT